jgi:glycosyltransferase involved in cell wall biosynthesis
MSASPLVTALMVNRNNGRFLGEAIGSVVTQTHGDWELIVVENGSTDDSSAVLEDWMRAEPRIRLIRLTSAVSIPVARNLGLAEAQGEYIATIDSDDIWLPDRLGRQLEVMNQAGNARMGVCGSNVWLIDEGGTAIGSKRYPHTHNDCLQAFWVRNPFCHSATLVRRCCFAYCGQYDETFEVAEELDLWFRIGRHFQLYNVTECLVKYRVWRGNATFRTHRRMVQNTLRARRLAATQHGYRAGIQERLAFAATWLAQWLSPGLAEQIFRACVLSQSFGSRKRADPGVILGTPAPLQPGK